MIVEDEQLRAEKCWNILEKARKKRDKLARTGIDYPPLKQAIKDVQEAKDRYNIVFEAEYRLYLSKRALEKSSER